MGQAIGVSHSVLTKIAAGTQKPGRRLLEAISAHPKVNPGWLLSGEGAPILAEAPEGPASGWPIPVADQLLPGPLNQYRNLLSEQIYPTAGLHYRDSRYWFRVPFGSRVTQISTVAVLPGDLLLFETDRRHWPLETFVDNRLCVVQLQTAELFIGRVTWFPGGDDEPSGLSCDTFSTQIDHSALVEQITILKHPSGQWNVSARKMAVTEEGSLKRVAQPRLMPVTPSISLANIVSVCVLLVRTDF